VSSLGLHRATQKGHAIECRLYAENPANNFYPCTGTIQVWNPNTHAPAGARVRFDSGVQSGEDAHMLFFVTCISVGALFVCMCACVCVFSGV
jgi:acetyl/propionyl-CoA carboxylase alpha subunit